MSAENEGKTAQNPPAMPALPDGIGLGYEEIAEELSKKSETIVRVDDPIMMMVPLCNVFLSQQHALQERHKGALAQVMSDKTDNFVQSVQKTVDELGQTLSSDAAQSFQAAFSGQQETMRQHEFALQKHTTSMFWLAAITTTSALVNVGVFVALFLLRG